MIWNDDTRKFTLSNGRTFDAGANRAIGLEDGTLYVGYDSSLSMDCTYEEDDYNDLPTAAERLEIADYMIALWTAYRDSVRDTGEHS